MKTNVKLAAFWLISVLLPVICWIVALSQRDLNIELAGGYGWIAPLTLAAGVAMFLTRWDRQLQWPVLKWMYALLAIGWVLCPLSILLGEPWLAALGFGLEVTGFLASQQDRQSQSLLSLSWLLVPVVGLPQVAGSALESMARVGILGSADSVLRVLQIPHLLTSDGIDIPGQTIPLETLSSSFLGCSMFVACSMLYSVWRRRNGLTVVFNAMSAAAWWFVFHASELSATATLRQAGSNLGQSVITGTCLLAVCILFLSSELGILGLLRPVPDGPGDSRRANPLIVFWNWINEPRMKMVGS